MSHPIYGAAGVLVGASARAGPQAGARRGQRRAAFSDRRTAGTRITLGPLKSRAARRTVGIPAVIVPALQAHLEEFVGADLEALVFPVASGAPLRRSNFNRMSGWKHAVEAIGARGLHFHDLRHTGNTFAAASGAGIKDLMARMGHDSARAAMIYQHRARGADRAITSAIDARWKPSVAGSTKATTDRLRRRFRRVNGTLMARRSWNTAAEPVGLRHAASRHSGLA